jgi:putative transposase
MARRKGAYTARGGCRRGVARSPACRDRDYPRLWQDIKKGFTRRIGATSPWQARYWEHTITGETDLRRHVDYVHINPVKHGLVARVVDWPHSSFHRYVSERVLPWDWAGDVELTTTGERL